MLTSSAVRRWRLVHTWTSLVCTAFLLMLCITGLPLIWIDEIDGHFAGHPPIEQVAPGIGPADLDAIYADAIARIPDEVVTFSDWAFDGVLLGVNMADPGGQQRSRQLVYDARTGKYLQDLRTDNPNHPVRWFLRIMNRAHIQMFAGVWGSYFLAAMSVIFVLATISGVVLYAPFMRKLAFGEVRVERSRRTKWLDLHNLLGIVTVGWVLVVSITGIMNAFTVPLYAAWRAEAVPKAAARYAGQPLPASLVGPEMAKNAAQDHFPGSRMVRIVEPGYRDGSPRHYVVWLQGFTPITEKLFRPVLIEADTGKVAVADQAPWYLIALQGSRPLHFGDYGGTPLKILWSLFDLVAIVILSSGLYLFIAKRRRGRESSSQ